jgi:YidC/Oxa1 family membrane protein insertase
MKFNKRLFLVVLTFVLVFTLSACSSSDSTSMYTQPIGAEGGWGWLQWIITQIADLTYALAKALNGQYWMSLVIITLLIRSIGWPIYSKSNAMTMNMQMAQPELNKIQEKYKGRTDELSQKKMQQETMEVYKKYNINPLGCLLPFLQMPIFIAMYQVVRRVPISNGGAEGIRDYSDLNYTFLGIDLKGGVDFSVFQTMDFFNAFASLFPEIILSVLVGILMFGYQKYAAKKPDYLQNKKFDTPQARQTQNQMKYMSYFMVFMLVSIAITNNGIALYWIVGNAFQFFQTYINRKQTYKKYMKSKNIVNS